MYQILENIIYKDGKLYSSEIEKVLEINMKKFDFKLDKHGIMKGGK
jgi:hypothetical protein